LSSRLFKTLYPVMYFVLSIVDEASFEIFFYVRENYEFFIVFVIIFIIRRNFGCEISITVVRVFILLLTLSKIKSKK